MTPNGEYIQKQKNGDKDRIFIRPQKTWITLTTACAVIGFACYVSIKVDRIMIVTGQIPAIKTDVQAIRTDLYTSMLTLNNHSKMFESMDNRLNMDIVREGEWKRLHHSSHEEVRLRLRVIEAR